MKTCLPRVTELLAGVAAALLPMLVTHKQNDPLEQWSQYWYHFRIEYLAYATESAK